MRFEWMRLWEATMIGSLLTTASMFATVVCLGHHPGPLEVGAVFTSYACTYLCQVQSRQNYVWGLASVALYVALFWDASLMASATVNVWLVGCMVYGYWRWGPDGDTRPVRHLDPMMVPVYVLVTALVWLWAQAGVTILGGTMAYWDSVVLALTILAQFLLDNKRLETWWVWVAVNVVALYVYSSSDLYMVTIQYGVFLLWAFLSWYQWRISMFIPRPTPGSEPDWTDLEVDLDAALSGDIYTEEAARTGESRPAVKARALNTMYGRGVKS